ncbi:MULTISPECIES: hypothetical protein [unclassified Streptosporangium]|uniref:hypothetical protein n=1 Tax=unclassified Streptosporangium TaxID=2632669 RepID=UPI002E2B3B4B|nr:MULTISPECIES: hypothetical protein [unclassified Streptosporangium]
MTSPRLLACAMVTLVALTACTSSPGDPVVGPATAGGTVGTGQGSGAPISSPAAATLTPDEYRAELEEARGPVRDAVKKLASTGGLKTLGKQLQKTSGAVEGAVTRLSALAPPAEVKAQHDSYVEALGRLRTSFDTARQDAEEQRVCTGPAVLTGMAQADQLSDVEDVAKTLSGYPASVIPVKAAKERDRRLSNGRFIASEGRPGRAYLELRNGTKQDAVVVLVRGKKKAVTVYVRKKSNFKIRGVRDGSYKIYYTLGEDWDAKARTFTRSCTFEQFGKTVRFRTVNTATQIRWTDWTITLHAVSGGTVKPKKVKPGDFPA